jgi:hypothetical protein
LRILKINLLEHKVKMLAIREDRPSWVVIPENVDVTNYRKWEVVKAIKQYRCPFLKDWPETGI